jgi:hypothetical protein
MSMRVYEQPGRLAERMTEQDTKDPKLESVIASGPYW